MAVRRRRLGVGLILGLALVVGSLAWLNSRDDTDATLQLGFGPSDVAQLDAYYYAYAAVPTDVQHHTITDMREVEEIVWWLTDHPGHGFDGGIRDFDGGEAVGYRFSLRDGREFEVTFVWGSNNLYVGPDGRALTSRYGSPRIPDVGTTETVDPTSRPMTEG